MAQEIPKTINLLNPVTRPDDTWSRVYDWIFNLGKYLLVGVQLIVLAVFFSRFWIDKSNNDLTDNINDQVETLSIPILKQGEIRYNNLHALLADINTINTTQKINSTVLGSIIETVPNNIALDRFSFNEDTVSMTLIATDFATLYAYESSLKQNPLYKDVTLNLKKDSGDSNIEFSITLKIAREENA